MRPDFAQALTQIVSIRINRGETEQARKRLEQQIETSPNNALYYNLLGRVWMQANQADKAEIAFKKSLELNEQLEASYMNLAALYQRTNRMDEAIKEYEQLLEKNPKAVSAHMVLGIMAQQGKDNTKAKSHYRKILDVEPKFAPAGNNLAWLIMEEGGSLDEALTLAENARAQQSDNPAIADTLGWIYYQKQGYLKAVSLLKEAVEKLPESAEVKYHLGMALFKKGDETQAKKVLEEAFTLSPKFPGSDEARATLNSLNET